MATVTFDHITKAYADGTIAVNDLDLLIKDGEFLVLVGPSGCGKTTALRCLAGLAEILRLQRRLETTTIYVTHDQVEAMTMGDRIAVMNLGVLQQIGSPPELYDNPVNVFVAAFIGSPAMNFATAKAEGDALKLGGTKLELTGRAAEAAAQNHGRDLLIGFRPEDLQLDGQTGSNAVQIPAQIDVVEYLGHEELIHAQAEGHEIVALVPSEKKVQAGEQVDFMIPVEKLHVFDPETELNLTASG